MADAAVQGRFGREEGSVGLGKGVEEVRGEVGRLGARGIETRRRGVARISTGDELRSGSARLACSARPRVGKGEAKMKSASAR